MASEVLDLLRERLVTDQQINGILRKKKSDYYNLTVKHALVPEHIDNGWEVLKELKYKTQLRKRKTADVCFVDRVWRLFAEMGFHSLNRDRRLSIPYSDNDSLTQEVDVFAADDEIAVIIECKASSAGLKKSDFKAQIEAIGDKREGLITSTKKLLGNNRLKVVFILATHDYYLNKQDEQRLEEFGAHHYDNESISYYEELLKHLGTAARFQLEANLFPGQKVPAIDSRVPAIRGKMGGHTYYSFMVEPKKLLKLGYILHRSKANKKLMPTYQRLIKKTRLKKIRKFIENGGFFPNSIIVNIESNSNRGLKFESSSIQVADTDCRLGVLHLPKKYRSLFIIDGQHRLYGYSDTDYESKNAVPVVAFHNLERAEQARLFMEINENQKAVPKNLRHTLNADLQWDSDSQAERINALKLQIAQDLGEDLLSPLYDRIIVGENVRTETRTITLDAVKQGLDRGSFFGEFAGTKIKEKGTFFSESNDEFYAVLFPFLVDMFAYVQMICVSEWNKSAKEEGLLLVNLGVNSLLRIFSDIVDHFIDSVEITPKHQDQEEMLKFCHAYLDPLAHYFSELDNTERTKIRKAYGSGGPTKYWRILQRVISDVMPEFNPDGLAQYWEAESKAFNTRSFEMIRDIEEHLKRDFMRKLKAHHGNNWFKVGVPGSVYEASSALASKKNKDIFEPDEEKMPWDCLHIIDYRTIATYQGNWKDVFEGAYTRPGDEKISGGAKAKTKWLDKLNRIRNDTDHEYSVKQDEYEFLQEIHAWLIST